MLRRHWLACMGLAPLAALAIPQAWAADAPALLLANVYPVSYTHLTLPRTPYV